MLDKKCHAHPPSPYHTYKIFIQCDIIGGVTKPGMETIDLDFFSEENLPTLSNDRITESQVTMAFEFLRNPNKNVVFD